MPCTKEQQKLIRLSKIESELEVVNLNRNNEGVNILMSANRENGGNSTALSFELTKKVAE